MSNHSALNQFINALNPLSIQVDERDLAKRLNFAAGYGKLINFYDQNNQRQGDWSGFFLKDPLILIATISQTDYSNIYSQFTPVEHNLSALLSEYSSVDLIQKPRVSIENTIDPHAGRLFNLIFQLINHQLVIINDWLLYLQKGEQIFQLKTFIEVKVAQGLATDLWQFVSLQQLMSGISRQIDAPDYQLYESFQSQWKKEGNHSSIRLNKPKVFTFSSAVYDTNNLFRSIFGFFVQVIDSARESFAEFSEQSDHYPDTGLLIAFTKLLDIPQTQLNLLTEKHLEFYYKDILKQTSEPALADEAFLCLQLNPKLNSYKLEEGTLFNAGVDSNKVPIQFSSLASQEINQTRLKQVITLFYHGDRSKNSSDIEGDKHPVEKTRKNLSARRLQNGDKGNFELSNTYGLFRESIKSPDKVKSGQNGVMQSWPLFGDNQGEKINLGFSFSSPLLYLQGGNRTITVNINLSAADGSTIDISDYQKSQVYLSSKKIWNKAPAVITQGEDPQTLLITISLSPSFPEVEAFNKTSEHDVSQWPMLKLELADQVNLRTPPTIDGITINTVVENFNIFEANTSNGKLSVGRPFYLFGPVAESGNSLYLGSAEIFAKPISAFSLQLFWENLPDDFSNYYQQYNDYIKKNNLPVEQPTVDGKVFTNDSFKVFFYLLRNAAWVDIDQADDDVLDPGRTLFSQSGTKLNPERNFDFTDTLPLYQIPRPELLKKPLKFSNKSDSGFIKVQLKYPLYGFGNALYSKIVADTTLKNALVIIEEASIFNKIIGIILKLFMPLMKTILSIGSWLTRGEISKKDKSDDPIQALPNLPFAPKVKSLSCTYTANFVLDLNAVDNDYPFELYHLDTFANYKVYDNSQALLEIPDIDELDKDGGQETSRLADHKGGSAAIAISPKKIGDFVKQSSQPGSVQKKVSSKPVKSTNATENKLSLFPGVNAKGTLYLGLSKLLSPGNLTIYFELSAPDKRPVKKTGTVNFLGLTNDGWQPITILKDSTFGFSCSGIIELAIPDLMTSSSQIMPVKQYWVAISTDCHVSSIANVIYLNCQAIKAKRVVNNEILTAEPLVIKNNTITKTSKPIEALSEVSQPFASFNGVMAENKQDFYQRVSQRINTKNRANTLSDYETLAFIAMPDLYFVKAKKDTNAIAKVDVAVVKRYSDVQHPDAFLPFANLCELEHIAQYLQTKCSKLVKVEVNNMNYQPVKITASILLYGKDSDNLIRQKVNQAIRLYLSPWIETEQPQIQINTGISEARLITFLEGLSIIKSVRKLTFSYMPSLTDVDNTVGTKEKLVTNQTTDSSIKLLVSAKEHDIEVVC